MHGPSVMNPEDTNPILDYRSNSKPDSRRADPFLPLALSIPGALCWTVFACAKLNISLPDWILGIVALSWPLAVLFAVGSIMLYLRFSKRLLTWAVIINLIVNISGLIFTIAMLALDHGQL
jgi:hypothetical protein